MSLDQDGLHLAGIYLIQTQEEGKKSLICLFVVDSEDSFITMEAIISELTSVTSMHTDSC